MYRKGFVLDLFTVLVPSLGLILGVLNFWQTFLVSFNEMNDASSLSCMQKRDSSHFLLSYYSLYILTLPKKSCLKSTDFKPTLFL